MPALISGLLLAILVLVPIFLLGTAAPASIQPPLHVHAPSGPRATVRTRKRTSEGEEDNVTMSCKLRGDNIVVINGGGNTLADPSTTSWGKVCTLR
jgi:hypothetical protein